MRTILLLGALAVLATAFASYQFVAGRTSEGQEQEPVRLQRVPPPIDPNEKYVFDILLHTPEEIRALLERAEDAVPQPRREREKPSVALVLHGPEIDIFAIGNYAKYKDIVDLAAKLDAYGIIDVKMCLSTMRRRGLDDDDVPPFVELVPYGPDEIERLKREGYIYL